MAQRSEDKRIQELYDKGIKPYSISKLNAIDGCLREAYYTYKEHNRGDDNIYGIMGTKIHDVLEKIYNKEAKKEDLLPALKAELEYADILGVDFPKDFRGGNSIRNNWIKDMADYCRHFRRIPGEALTEQLIIYKVDDKRYLRGYVDLTIVVDAENKVVDIYDFKTSSVFKKEDLKHHGRQLVLYGMAFEQAGYKVRKIAWDMLKYVKVEYMGYKTARSTKKTLITKMVQRNKLVKELELPIRCELSEQGWNLIDIDLYVDDLKKYFDNLLCLDVDLKQPKFPSCFKFSEAIVEYPFTKENQGEVLEYINTNANKFESLWDKDIDSWEPVIIDKENEFYCLALCSHRKHCDHLQKYSNKKLKGNDGNNKDKYTDLF